MKKIKYISLLVITLSLFTNCVSTVEIFDQWEGETLGAAENQKVLIVNKTNNKDSKERFEKDLVARFEKSGIKAEAAHAIFPSLESKKRSEEEIDKLIQKLKDAGFTSIVISGLKGKIEMSETTTTGGYDKEMNTGEGIGVSLYNYSYHYYGFGSFYGGIYNSNVGSIYIEPESNTTSYNVYTLEVVTYDLTKKKEEHVAGVLTVKVTDPRSYEEIVDSYTKMIVKQFKKLM
ncbi:MAG: hypothetical protein KAH07_06580 [Flavobacteriaceae bacterium]|nr:hypothetical protein [Flavobacteriaceae bacterium]